MAKRPSAKWAGVLHIPNLGLSIDGGLYTASARRKPVPFLQIHTACSQTLEAPKGNGRQERDEEEDESPAAKEEPAQTTRQAYCPACKKPIMADEIGYVVETRVGRMFFTTEEREALKSPRSKAIDGKVVHSMSTMLETVGTGRRLYFFPKPDSVDAYYLLLRTLQKTGNMVFVPEIVLDKRPYVLVIHPVQMDPEVFGSSRTLLVADELCDTEAVKNPDEYQLLPAEEPALDDDRVRDLSKLVRKVATDVNLADCVNPQQARLKRFVAKKISEARTIV